MTRGRIDNASAATARALRFMASARTLLGGDHPVNSVGVFMDRRALAADLRSAKHDVDAALNELGIEWPDAADYAEI